ncbi:MAG: TolC family outer membrane protein [Rhodospirillales bacterium]|nr:TolC family outer membrane protein [Rhodospirillales bacterium]MCB9997098.1 TolC family outer membrane protein [Rhodospirillales bacterium]
MTVPMVIEAQPAAVENEMPLMSEQAASIAPAAGSDKVLSLRDAVAIGVNTNPETGVVQTNRRATDEELRQAQALYLPSIDFQGDTGFEHSDDPATRSGQDDDPENLWRYEAGLTLTQLLFDGWETKYENERQKMRILSASNRVRETSELVGLAIVEAYLEVLRQRDLLRIARQNVADHITILEQIGDSADAGRSTEADNEQARARMASARATEASVREQLRFAEAAFIREVGDPPAELGMPLVPVDGLSADVEREVKVALHQSPTIDIFEADIKVAHAEMEGAKSTFYPQVDFQLNAREGKDLNGVRGRDTSASALVTMDWNLYRGGGDSARVREHINREAQAKEARAEAARSVEFDVRQTWARMVSAGERARQFAAQADANTEVVKAYKDQFDLSRRTLLDVLDAQNELFVSRSNTVNAEFLEMFAVYRLMALKGELLTTLGVDYPRESDPAKM